MAALVTESEVWKQIDLSESYMVCCMFEEAASIAASVVEQIRTATSTITVRGTQLDVMMESAGMVYAQSLKEMGRTRELLDELKVLFGAVHAIPVQVFLTGACMQISEGYSANLQKIFEVFLEIWIYKNDESKVCLKTGLQSSSEGCFWQAAIPVEKYLQVADVYAITVLSVVLKRPDLAITWVEKAAMPEENRQDLLRRLHSLHLAADSSSSLDPNTTSGTEGGGVSSIAARSSTVMIGKSSSKTKDPQNRAIGDKLNHAALRSSLPSIKRISDRRFLFKFGNFRLVLPHGKIMFLSSLMLFALYIFRKRRATLKRAVSRQVSSIRKALVDAWQLAFSVQVNPLAAIQQLPAATAGGSR